MTGGDSSIWDAYAASFDDEPDRCRGVVGARRCEPATVRARLLRRGPGRSMDGPGGRDPALDDEALWGKPVTDERYLLVS